MTDTAKEAIKQLGSMKQDKGIPTPISLETMALEKNGRAEGYWPAVHLTPNKRFSKHSKISLHQPNMQVIASCAQGVAGITAIADEFSAGHMLCCQFDDMLFIATIIRAALAIIASLNIMRRVITHQFRKMPILYSSGCFSG